MKKIILLATISIVCASCARMVVRVKTADLATVQKKYQTLKEEQTKIETSLTEAKLKKQITLKKQVKEKKKEIDKLIQQTKTLHGIGDDFKNIANSNNLDEEQYSTLGVFASNNSNPNIKLKGKEIKTSVDEKEDLEEQLTQLKKSITTIYTTPPRKNLLGDLLTSYVTSDSAKRKDKIWKSKYNEAKSNARFGNADIAVVLMEDPESYNNNYSIKGVRVDADKLIQSSFDVLAQSITLLASTTGVVPQGGGDEDNYFAPSAIPQIKQLTTKNTELRKKQKQLKAYKNLIILEILNRDLDNAKTDDEVKKAIKEITAIWTSYKSKLAVKE